MNQILTPLQVSPAPASADQKTVGQTPILPAIAFSLDAVPILPEKVMPLPLKTTLRHSAADPKPITPPLSALSKHPAAHLPDLPEIEVLDLNSKPKIAGQAALAAQPAKQDILESEVEFHEVPQQTPVAPAIEVPKLVTIFSTSAPLARHRPFDIVEPPIIPKKTALMEPATTQTPLLQLKAPAEAQSNIAKPTYPEQKALPNTAPRESLPKIGFDNRPLFGPLSNAKTSPRIQASPEIASNQAIRTTNKSDIIPPVIVPAIQAVNRPAIPVATPLVTLPVKTGQEHLNSDRVNTAEQIDAKLPAALNVDLPKTVQIPQSPNSSQQNVEKPIDFEPETNPAKMVVDQPIRVGPAVPQIPLPGLSVEKITHPAALTSNRIDAKPAILQPKSRIALSKDVTPVQRLEIAPKLVNKISPQPEFNQTTMISDSVPPIDAIPELRPAFLAPDRLDPQFITTLSGSASSIPKQVAAQISQALANAPDRPVEIALDPVELGKVRMILNTSEGHLIVQIMAERPETSELMRRHVAQLESEFRNIGYDDIGFEFSQGNQREPEHPDTAEWGENAEQLPQSDLSQSPQKPVTIQLGEQTSLDLRL